MKYFLFYLFLIPHITAVGFELVKCGTVKNSFKPSSLIVVKSKTDGTTLFNFGFDRYVVLKPFVHAIEIKPSRLSLKETNIISDLTVNGIRNLKYRVKDKSFTEYSNPDVIYSSISDKGYVDYKWSREQIGETEYYLIGESSSQKEIGTIADTGFKHRLEKVDFTKGVIETIYLTDTNYVNSTFNQNAYPSPNSTTYYLNTSRRFIIPKQNGENTDFYLLTDDELYPTTSLENTKLQGEVLKTQINTINEEQLSVELSNDLSSWTKIKTLIDANKKLIEIPSNGMNDFIRIHE